MRQYTFVVFVILLIFFLLYLYFFVPETKNKSFDEIASQFSSRKARPRVDGTKDDAKVAVTA